MDRPTQAALILRGQLIRLDQKCARLGAGQDERNAARDELEALPASEREGYLTALPGAEVETPGAATEPAKHTPGDTWTYEGGARGGHIMPDNVFSSPLTIHHAWSEFAPEGTIAAANMKHAVLAVNCHDDMKRELGQTISDMRSLLSLIDAEGYAEDVDLLAIVEIANQVADRHAAAIAKAEGRTTC